MRKLSIAAAALLAAVCVQAQPQTQRAQQQTPAEQIKADTSREPICPGKYDGTAGSLDDYVCPEWFRDAKFGIWAHWGPQCEPEDNDWYARNMYIEGERQYKNNLDVKPHPSEFGFKDWINEFHAERWDPEDLISLYEYAGAKYFVSLANHHDNFDLWDSKYQPWNSVNMGPYKDIVKGWAEAARRHGMRFGVSSHAGRAYSWYEVTRRSDTKGPYAGVPYDGFLTKEDGWGKWWEGYDPQDLYEQRQPLRSLPDQKYYDKFYNRTVDLINRYSPDLLYFDDRFLPLYPASDCGPKIVSHYYNKSIAEKGFNDVVVTGKNLTEAQKHAILLDVEKGAADRIMEYPWQTCTCIGNWHYDKHIYYDDTYKSSTRVIQDLVDIVSKNGNLLLSVPIKGDGTIDPTERRIVTEIGDWMQINGESIYGTRPWKVYGEGPSVGGGASEASYSFNEGKQTYTSADFRFNKKGDDVLYVTVYDIPEGDVSIRSLGAKSGLADRKIKSVTLLGSAQKLNWKQGDDALTITGPDMSGIVRMPVFKVEFK